MLRIGLAYDTRAHPASRLVDLFTSGRTLGSLVERPCRRYRKVGPAAWVSEGTAPNASNDGLIRALLLASTRAPYHLSWSGHARSDCLASAHTKEACSCSCRTSCRGGSNVGKRWRILRFRRCREARLEATYPRDERRILQRERKKRTPLLSARRWVGSGQSASQRGSRHD
jgi:hypothetical protein